ncbi:hypothetical protein J7E95_29740 [Streptomyces sp. ISL-14]|nr:hypothetical protein [Streptomyces sp. ISL-14]
MTPATAGSLTLIAMYAFVTWALCVVRGAEGHRGGQNLDAGWARHTGRTRMGLLGVPFERRADAMEGRE